MKRCNHTCWLSLCSQGNETCLLVSDRLSNITNHIPDPDIHRPSLFVLIGNAAKSVALRQLFGVKRSRRFTTRRSAGEIHLHVDPSSIFHERPVLIADGDLPSKSLRGEIPTDKCHEITRRTVQRSSEGFVPDQIASGVYAQLLFPFADVFCFFGDDLGGFKQVARHLAAWLEQGHASTLPRSTHPRVVIVTEKIPPGAEIEARKAFLWLLREETTKDLSEQISAIDIVALFPNGSMSVDARHRLLKERLMDGSDQVRKNREDARSLFSVTHFTAFLKSACEHFANTAEKPFDFVKASRAYNPVALDLEEHLSNFLKHIKSPSELTEFAAPVIASSLFLDSYPPNTHRKSSLLLIILGI
jgi:hypothetical protein